MEHPSQTEARLRQLMSESTEEHRELLAMLRSIETIVEGQPHPATGDLARKLAELAQAFEAHLLPEEESALYTWLPTNFAGLTDELDHCKQQHAPLLATLHQLAQRAEHAESAELDSELSVHIRTAIASLRQHEAAESGLLQRALTQMRQAS
jgi:hypothetical protein